MVTTRQSPIDNATDATIMSTTCIGRPFRRSSANICPYRKAQLWSNGQTEIVCSAAIKATILRSRLVPCLNSSCYLSENWNAGSNANAKLYVATEFFRNTSTAIHIVAQDSRIEKDPFQSNILASLSACSKKAFFSNSPVVLAAALRSSPST